MFRFLLLTCALLIGVSNASAQDFLPNTHKSAKGYSIRYPQGWFVVDANTTASLNRGMNNLMPETRGTGADVVITQGSLTDAAPSLNVVVVRGEMPIDDEARATLKSLPTKIASTMKARVENIVVRDETINGNRGLVVQYDLNIATTKLTQMLFSVPKAGQTYMICVTAKKDDFRSFEPTFRMMVATLELSSFNQMPPWLLWGLIGGAIGGIVTVLAKTMKG